MSGSDKRCTTIDFQHADSATGDPTMPDRVLGAPAPTSKLRSPFAATDSQQPKENSVRRYSRLRRPTGFPIKSDGYERGTPWARYPKRYTLRFGIGYTLTGAQQVAKPCNEVLVQQFSGKSDNDGLQRLQDLRHRNIHAVLEVFRHGKETYIVFEYMELSLHEVATVGINTDELAGILRQVCPPLFRPMEGSAQLSQVVDGLVYLAEQGVEHGALTCSNVLVSKEGAVKLGSCVLQLSMPLLTWLARRVDTMPATQRQDTRR
jgi:serine/threonine protein kinase